MDTGALVAGPADFAGVVGGPERADHELAGPDVLDLTADLLDDADILMAHRRRPLDRFDPAVGPQVRAAHTARRQPDDGIGRLDDPRVLAVLHPDITRAIQNSTTHEVLLAVDDDWPGGRGRPGELANRRCRLGSVERLDGQLEVVAGRPVGDLSPW